MQPCSPYNCFIPFKRHNVDKISDNIFGIYGFWYKKRCLYVGKAERQSIKSRLMQHWSNCHNKDLQAWITVYGKDIKIAFKGIDENAIINKSERFYIDFFDPVTNKTK